MVGALKFTMGSMGHIGAFQLGAGLWDSQGKASEAVHSASACRSHRNAERCRVQHEPLLWKVQLLAAVHGSTSSHVSKHFHGLSCVPGTAHST